MFLSFVESLQDLIIRVGWWSVLIDKTVTCPIDHVHVSLCIQYFSIISGYYKWKIYSSNKIQYKNCNCFLYVAKTHFVELCLVPSKTIWSNNIRKPWNSLNWKKLKQPSILVQLPFYRRIIIISCYVWVWVDLVVGMVFHC